MKYLEVSNSQKQNTIDLILPKKEQLTILSRKDQCRSLLGRIEDPINCFRYLLTFKHIMHLCNVSFFEII